MSTFSDWGAAGEFEELAEAKKWALEQIAQVAKARGWAEYYSGTLEAFVAEAATNADGWFSDDVDGFYQGLVDRIDVLGNSWKLAGSPIPAGWDKLRNAFAAAAGAAAVTLEGREAGSVATVAKGTVDGSIETVKKVTNPFKSPWPWVALAVAIGVAKAAK